MPQQSDPADIEAEIERTRGELADTIDMIAEKVSPKRAVSRTADRVRLKVKGDTRARAEVGVPETGERVHMIATSGGATETAGGTAGSAGPSHGLTAVDKHEGNARATGLPGGTSPGSARLYQVRRQLRTDRVLMAAGAVVGLVLLVVLARRGNDRPDIEISDRDLERFRAFDPPF